MPDSARGPSAIRVALDGLILLSPQTGIARYASELCRQFAASPAVELHIFLGGRWAKKPPAAPMPGIAWIKRALKAILPDPYGPVARMRQIAFDAGVKRFGIDLHHAPSFIPMEFDGPTVATVHDLSHIRYPGAHPAERVRHLQERLPRALERSSIILTISDAVRDELIQTFSLRASKIVRTWLGVSERFRPYEERESSPVLGKYGLRHKRYLLAVGTLEPRKNLLTVLDAYDSLGPDFHASCPLAVAGMQGWNTERLSARLSRTTRAVRLLGFVSDEELPHLYAGAAGLVFASLYEGFGFPILEAMASGTDVITADRGSMREISGGFARLVDPEDAEQIAEQMRACLERSPQDARRLQAARSWAGGFTWERCAKETVAAYRTAMQR
jgi:alpha-1,3-rhamnosyl/mannosyltransferase